MASAIVPEGAVAPFNTTLPSVNVNVFAEEATFPARFSILLPEKLSVD